MIDLAPGLDGTSHHYAFAGSDVRQYLADLSGGEGRGCVQIILRSSHRLPRAKLHKGGGEGALATYTATKTT